MRFNLSEWALNHRSFVVYCMVALTIVGAMSYYRLGRNEDPAFTFRTMVVQAAWPGATLQETLDQVTERIERTLKETPHLDFLRSYTSAGVTTIFVTLKGSTPAGEVPDIWYHVRKSVGDMRHTLSAGVLGPGFNDEFGDTFGIIYGFTADGFTQRELRDYVEDVRARLLRVADVSKVEILGAQAADPVHDLPEGWGPEHAGDDADVDHVGQLLAQGVVLDLRLRQLRERNRVIRDVGAHVSFGEDFFMDHDAPGTNRVEVLVPGGGVESNQDVHFVGAGHVAFGSDAKLVPRREPLDVRGEDVFRGDRDPHVEDRPGQNQVGRLAS